MVDSLSTAALLLILLCTCGPKRGNSQLECYTTNCVGAPNTTGGAIEDCCLGDGLFFTMGGEGCTACVVFGWMNGTQFSGVERGRAYSLYVGFIKGGDSPAGSTPIRFNVDISEGTAVQGDDFSVQNVLNVYPRPSFPDTVTITLEVDGIALEPNETFQLRLIPENEASMPGFDKFLMDTLEVTIIDQDTMFIQLTELEYRGPEKDGKVAITVERHVPIATSVTVVVVGQNYTSFSRSGRPLPADIPTGDLSQYKGASTFPIERSDFNITPIEVTFEPQQSNTIPVMISINDDEINEPDEYFLISLELVGAIHPERVNLDNRNISICKIEDNDLISIGFEFPKYRFREDGELSGDAIYLVKERNVTSEQSFEIRVTAVGGGRPDISDATFGVDYSTGATTVTEVEFLPDEQRKAIPFEIFDDDKIEGTETFHLYLSRGERFLIGRNRAIVLIEDNENATVGFEKDSLEVTEDLELFELCLRIFEPMDPQADLPLSFFLELETTAGSADDNDYIPITYDNNPIFTHQFGQTLRRVCFTVTVVDDILVELNESFSVRAFLEVPTSGIKVIPDEVHITILDNDLVQIGFDVDQYTVTESVGHVTLNISVLDGALGTDVSLELSITNGTAIAPTDFTAVSNLPLMFNAESPTVLVNVTINNDELFETFEKNIQVFLVLMDPILDSVTITPDLANVWIQDDDPVTVGFESVFYSVDEGTATVSLTVRVQEGQLGRSVTIGLDTLNGTAVAPSDYTAITDRRLVFDETTRMQTIVITIVNDDEVEANETFTAELSLVSPDAQRLTIDPDVVIITIVGDDIPPPVISVMVPPEIANRTYVRNKNMYSVAIGREFQLVCTSSGTYTAWYQGGVPVPQVGIAEAGGGSGFRPAYLFPLTEVVGQLYAYQENDSIAILGTRKSLDVVNVIGIQEVASGVYECRAFDGEGVANTEQVVVKTAEPSEQGNSAYLRFSTGPTVEELMLMFGYPSMAFVPALFNNMVLSNLGDSLGGQQVVDCYIVASRVLDEEHGWTRFECNVTQFPQNDMLIEHVDRAANSLSDQLDGVFITDESITSISGFCAACRDDTRHGTYSWPETELNMNVTLECEHGPIVPDGKATRLCNSLGNWDPYYGEECVTTVTYNIQQFGSVEITAENAEEIIRGLAEATSAAVEEEDQSTQNLEVIAYVFESISVLLDDGELQVNENIIEDATDILDSISDWPQEVVQTQSSLIVESFEEIAENLVENNNFTQLEITREDIILVAKRIPHLLIGEEFNAPPIESSGLLYVNVTEASLELPHLPINEMVGVFFTFYTTPILFPLASPEKTASNETNDIIDSAVIGASIAGGSIQGLEDPVVITQSSSRIRLGMPWSNVRCVSWEFNVTEDGHGNWTTRGCEATHIDTYTGTIRCECNHLTNFAILVGINDETETRGFITNVALQVAAIAGSIVSMLSLILAMVVLRKWKARDAKTVHIQHSIALFCMLFFFLIGIEQTDSDAVCTAMSLAIQYFTLAVAFIMGVETVLMFQNLRRTSLRRINLASITCWTLPIPLLAVGLATLGTGENYLISGGETDPQYCFFDQTGVMFGVFLGPLFATLLFIIVVFVATIRTLLKQRRKTFAPLHSTAARTLFGVGIITLLFGLTWVFGAITFMDGPDVFLYLFVVFTSLQGLIYCIFQKDSQDVCIGLLKYQCLKKYASTTKHTSDEVPSLDSESTHTVRLTSITIQADEELKVEKLISEEQATCIPDMDLEATSVIDCETPLSTPEPSHESLQSSREQEYTRKLSAQLLIPRKHIQLKNLIGDGEFGIVYKAQLCTPERVGADSDTVAVKTLKGFFDEAVINAMMKESLKMKEFNHPNVLNMIGVCTDGGPAPFIVMPFMTNGSLQSYLRKERPNLIATTADRKLVEKLMTMCLEIARGMEYLASKKFVHRDLATRNCMLDDNFIIRIADFGLSENVYAKKYFRMENHKAAKLPIKWMAPESLSDGLFTEKSDVWSFGVVCWEVFSGGKSPYAGIHPLSLIGMVEDGHRLGKPKNVACSNEMYQIMRMCWHADPACRPPFTYFVESISKLSASQNYPDAACKNANPVIIVTQSSEPNPSSIFLNEQSDRKCLDRSHDHRTTTTPTTTTTTTTTTRRQPEKHHTVNGKVHEGIPKFNPDHRTHQASKHPLISVPTPVVSHYAQKTEGGSNKSIPLTEQASPRISSSFYDSCAVSHEMIPSGGAYDSAAPYECIIAPYESIVSPYDSIPEPATHSSIPPPKDTLLQHEERVEHSRNVSLIAHIAAPIRPQKPSAISRQSNDVSSNGTEDNSSTYDTVDHYESIVSPYESIVSPYDSIPEPAATHRSIPLPQDTPCELREKDRVEHGGRVCDVISRYEAPMRPQKPSAIPRQSNDVSSNGTEDNSSTYDTVDHYESIVAPYESIVAPYDSIPEPAATHSSIPLPQDTPCELRGKDRVEHGGRVRDVISRYEARIHDSMQPQKTSRLSTNAMCPQTPSAISQQSLSTNDTVNHYESIVAPYDTIP